MNTRSFIVVIALQQVLSLRAANDPFNNIVFINQGETPAYICRDQEKLAEVAPGIKCFGSEFFKDADGKMVPRYFKWVRFGPQKSCTQRPDVGFALIPGSNYRVSSVGAVKIDMPWPNGCPPLTPEQIALEKKNGKVLKSVTESGILADDIKKSKWGNYWNEKNGIAVEEPWQASSLESTYNAMLGAVGVVEANVKKLNHVFFLNDSDKIVYICRDKDDMGEIQPNSAKCFDIDFFKGTSAKPMPRYFKINYSKKSCADTPDVKYALAPNSNYRITTKAALKTNAAWPNGCPSLTPDQQALEQQTGSILDVVKMGGTILADDIKGGVLTGWNETTSFVTKTTPEALKNAYGTVASGVTKAANAVADSARAAGDWLKGAGGTVKGGFEDLGGKIAESKANPSNW